MTELAPRTGTEAANFLLHQHNLRVDWHNACQKVQRIARGIPGVYPSALTSAMATPKSERVYHVADLRRGMVAYSDDPHDSNPFGHVYFIAGRVKGTKDRSDPSKVLVWSSDTYAGVHGGVGLVRLTYFKANWGDNFQFGATWMNGYDFADFNKPAKPVANRVHLSDNYKSAIEDVERELHRVKGTGHPKMVKALEDDLARMKRKLATFD